MPLANRPSTLVPADCVWVRRKLCELEQIHLLAVLEHIAVLGGWPPVKRMVVQVAAEDLLAVRRVLGRVEDVKMPPWVGHVMEGYF